MPLAGGGREGLSHAPGKAANSTTSSGKASGPCPIGGELGAGGEAKASARSLLDATPYRLDTTVQVALLTAGRDKPYALGLAAALIDRGIAFELVGSDDLDGRELPATRLMTVRNIRGDQSEGASLLRKVSRVLAYYARLVRYAATTKAPVLHILWNNKFELFDRTVLMLYYRLLGKRVALTAHNVNVARRDGHDNLLNRASLCVQYALAIQVGINNTLPTTEVTSGEARERLGLSGRDRAILFFGNIAPYKGLEYMVEALAELAGECKDYRLIIAGRPKGAEDYWHGIRSQIERLQLQSFVVERITYIPDEEVEVYFKATDALVLPYTHIFQSGVLFLGYSFGVPVIATDIGSLAEDIVEGETGFVCRPKDASDLARALRSYFASPLFAELAQRRSSIKAFANQRYSWEKVGEQTELVYRSLISGGSGIS